MAEYVVTRYVAPHDKNGNPRRVWVVIPTTGPFSRWWFAHNEGYSGIHALPADVLEGEMMRFPDVKVSVSEYKRILKEGPSGVMV